ncbi:hypothetical protein P3T37_006140 [Kitasatospora sp. MAA4]|uniref:hypothetical protein n=1 Tax=Kitasatospora sp. MAA4 TaxID=3035093 RepID=UPI002475893D|nr:hypothetical protein [Kitasatospora sp. MAA4]MDH6136709.1 hypothetical protein [Kitasatospora sp. MAA4]
MNQATVVAFYGAKDDALLSIILEIQRAAGEEFGADFTPRTADEVHATLIGLGDILKTPNGKGTPSERRPVDLVAYICSFFSNHQITAQFGGFKNDSHALRSRGRSLHERSLVIDDDALVIIGWPLREPAAGADPSDVLDGVRAQCQRFGFRHKYHGSNTVDPDLYMVLGRLARHEGRSDAQRVQSFERNTRKLLAEIRPALVTMDAERLSVVFYSDRSLPSSSSLAVPVCGAADLEVVLNRLHGGTA